MFKNYLKIAWRNIKRHKGYSFINIAGLAIGMAICILILLYVQYELSYDKFNEHKDRIFRIQRQWLNADGSLRGEFSSLAPSFVPLLEKEFPEMEHVVRILPGGTTVVNVDEKRFVEERFFLAEDDIFEVFTLPLIKGNSKTALKNPNTLVISESIAQKYFGDEDPIGKLMKVDQRNFYEVTGVMKDIPENSHVHFDFIGSFITLKGQFKYLQTNEDYFFGTRNLTDNVTYVYTRLAAGVDSDQVALRIPEFIDRHLGTRTDDSGNIIRASQSNNLFIRNVTDIHLQSHTPKELDVNSDIRYVTIFSLIAVFILIIACINFMNLSTARARQRAKEVGLRKVAGANRRLLTSQFIGESLLIALIALVLAVVFVVLLLPFFSAFSGCALSLGWLFNPIGILILLGVFLVTGLASGFYPAVYLSAFRPATILRGELTRGIRGARMRKVLVVFQFAVSIALIICVGIVFRQMRFLQNADIGYDRENIVMIPADSIVRQKWTTIKQELESSPHILHAAVSKRAPTGRLLDAPGFIAEVNGERLRNPFTMPHNRVGHDFFKTYGMKIIAGRDFSVEHPTDKTEAFIINETALRRLGWEKPEDALGAPMFTFAPNRRGRIIGVVADFNYESMHEEIRPILTYVRILSANTTAIRVAAGSLKEALDHAKGVWSRFNPEYPFRYDFLDDRIRGLYRNEQRMMQMFGYFSLLAIIIGCLGLFGLASFTTEQRTKEIGIRKVLGASLSNIIVLLSQEFTKWVLAANIIAWPIAYFAMNKWLDNFVYQVSIGWTVFVLAAILTFLIALLTVSYQSIRSALANPADSLRYE
ncbi:MAG: ABC transporter permease [Candidatus Aminicenantes bacterium]|nr:MAG: ABC transporter permease [Candidatus Aminicenantes bacterium]